MKILGTHVYAPWEDRAKAYKASLQQTGVRRRKLLLAGMHMHIGSGVDYEHLARVCDSMADLVIGMDHDLHAISAGGGLSTPYRPDEPRVDTAHYFGLWDAARRRIEAHLKHPVRLEVEPGRRSLR